MGEAGHQGGAGAGETGQQSQCLSGADLAAEARKRWPRLGVIFATGQASLPEGSDASEATLLIKPYGGDDVERAIAAAVLRSGHRR